MSRNRILSLAVSAVAVIVALAWVLLPRFSSGGCTQQGTGRGQTLEIVCGKASPGPRARYSTAHVTGLRPGLTTKGTLSLAFTDGRTRSVRVSVAPHDGNAVDVRVLARPEWGEVTSVTLT